ncbi:cullin-1-like isoform X1 [Hibiscus syriacus]|uniref:Cullin-1-like isoform X1 n=1 Tax=Hibiscus syriacus TaxID=106335 RepID=A0A6A2ZCC4_HIBSY|nr:cullin-1-like isoform X1 [Hibiscus syriacus]
MFGLHVIYIATLWRWGNKLVGRVSSRSRGQVFGHFMFTVIAAVVGAIAGVAGAIAGVAVLSTQSVSGTSSSSKFFQTSRRIHKVLKDFGREFIDQELFKQGLQDWILENYGVDDVTGKQSFVNSPFLIDELRKLDLALEGVLFQQLFRMPCSPFASKGLKEDGYLALEDFLHVIVNGLWRTFWRKSGPVQFTLSCVCHPGSKLYAADKAISRGKLEELRGLALISKSGNDLKVHWNQVVELALFRQDILSGTELTLSVDTILVKLGGDLCKLELNTADPYQSVVHWIKCHAEVLVSSVERIWNSLGNANWGDLGTLQVLLATFYSIVQWNGPPRKSISSLASAHSLRLQKRRIECHLAENENSIVPYQQAGYQHGEIVELDHNDNPLVEKASHLKLKQGEILLLEDQQQGQKSFQIQESFIGGIYFLYGAISLDYPTQFLTLYRQTKVLNILKNQGVSSKYLPEIIASGRLLHPGPCKKQSPSGRCDHPWCGTPILVTYPVGEPLSYIVARDGSFSSDDALRCCRDCLVALRSAATANVQHGDISPENIIRVFDVQGTRNKVLYIPVSWGRAVLEDRDSPAINLQFSSSHALQHGKLCPASDAESLVYLLIMIFG